MFSFENNGGCNHPLSKPALVPTVADPAELTRFKRDYLNPEGFGLSRA